MTAPASERRALTLIDASNFIFRAYHAITHLSTSKGVPTNAVYGFTRMMIKTLRELDPPYVALAFDKQSRAGRQAIDPNYKANREGPPPDLIPQFELIRRVVEVLALPVLEFEGWEADDVIGTLVGRAKEEGFSVQVVTGDKDFIQIVDDDVTLYDPMNDRHTSPADVKERLGIEPKQMRDYLALIGDAIDNVAKVPGIGPKTAAELIHQFGDVETMLARLSEVKKPKIRESIAAHAESLQRAKQLVSFRCDLPLDVSLTDLARKPIQETAARALFSELEFFKLLQEMPAQAPTPLAVEPKIIRTLEALQALAAKIREQGRVAIIPAYEGLPYGAQLVGLGLCVDDGQSYYVPIGHRGLLTDQLPEAPIREVLGPLFADPTIQKTGHDLKATSLVLASQKLSLQGGAVDVELFSYLLNPSRREHALTDLTRERLRSELPPIPQPGSATRGKGMLLSDLGAEELAPVYAARADAARRLGTELWTELEQSGLMKLAQEVELPLTPVLERMEMQGVRLEMDIVRQLSAKVDASCQVFLAEIEKLAGHPFNVNSNTQLAQVLYEEQKLPILKRGKTGPSTDQEVLEKLAQDHPLPRAVIEYRGLAKLKSTYLDPLPVLLRKDGRLHTSFHQASTATGRLSSSDPNLQNIPIRTEMGREIRAAFAAEPGWQLISADYSQIELRLLAHVAEDPALVDAFVNDEDIHTRTAAEVFGVAPSEVTPQQRRAAKAVNFGIAYGLSPHGLSTRLDISNEEARSIIDRYFARYSGISRYLSQTLEKARRTGYVETLFGRRRWMPELNSRNRMAVQAAERAAINMPIQGTAADLIKLAMIRVDHALRAEKLEARMLLQVHDELLFEAPEPEVEHVKALARQCMSGVASLRVPLKVDIGSGSNWSLAH